MDDEIPAIKNELVVLPKRVREAALTLAEPLERDPEFMHAVLCQVGLPRRQVEGREFTRTTGAASMLLEAGKWYDGTRYIEMPVPYGTRPRLVLFHICSEAVRRRSPEVEVERSVRAFLDRLGLDKGGKSYADFKRQMLALAACRMQIGYRTSDTVVNVKCDPIKQFEAWMQNDNGTVGKWPGKITLSTDFYETLIEHAVPLDPRAIAALQNSALALDCYTWLANRLCRVKDRKGVILNWRNLREQFGQEYGREKDFKREFLNGLRKAHAVYPDAKIEQINGGIRLLPSQPPIKRRQVVVALPAPAAPVQAQASVALPQPSNPIDLELVSAAALAELAAFAPNWKPAELLAMFNEFSTSKHPDQAKRDGFFLQWARSFTAKFSPGSADTASATSCSQHKALRESTLDQARKIAPGQDIVELERRWRQWSATAGGEVKSPDAAFLGWLRKIAGGSTP